MMNISLKDEYTARLNVIVVVRYAHPNSLSADFAKTEHTRRDSISDMNSRVDQWNVVRVDIKQADGLLPRA